MQTINDALPENQKMQFRIGLNLGDVMISGDNLYGDAINVAARLEAEAEPEGICISKTVLDMVSQKIKASFESVGIQSSQGFPRGVCEDPILTEQFGMATVRTIVLTGAFLRFSVTMRSSQGLFLTVAVRIRSS